MKTLTELQGTKLIDKSKPLTSNEILNLAPDNLNESNLLNELVRVLKEEIRNDILSTITHKLR